MLFFYAYILLLVVPNSLFFRNTQLFSSGRGSFLALSAAGNRGPPVHHGASLGPGPAPWRVLWAFEVVLCTKLTLFPEYKTFLFRPRVFPRALGCETRGSACTPRPKFGSRPGSVARALGVRSLTDFVSGMQNSSLPATGLPSRSRLWGTGARLYTTAQVWVPPGLRGACCGRAKSRNLASKHGIAFRGARAEQDNGKPTYSGVFVLLHCCKTFYFGSHGTTAVAYQLCVDHNYACVDIAFACLCCVCYNRFACA